MLMVSLKACEWYLINIFKCWKNKYNVIVRISVCVGKPETCMPKSSTQILSFICFRVCVCVLESTHSRNKIHGKTSTQKESSIKILAQSWRNQLLWHPKKG